MVCYKLVPTLHLNMKAEMRNKVFSRGESHWHIHSTAVSTLSMRRKLD